MSVKKIHVVSLLSSPRIELLAAYDGSVLVVQSMTPVRGMFKNWKKPLLDRLEKRQQNGFVTVVEERTDHFSEHSERILLGEPDPVTRRTWQNIALDHYYAMIAMGDGSGNQRGNLVLAKGLERHFLSSNINVEQDDKGRNKYDIDLDSLSGYNRALLLAVLAALCVNPINDRWLDEFLAATGNTLPKLRPHSLAVITHGVDASLAEAVDARRKQQYG